MFLYNTFIKKGGDNNNSKNGKNNKKNKKINISNDKLELMKLLIK